MLRILPSEENAAWFQRRLEKVVSIAKIFQNIRLRIGAGKVVKSAEWGCLLYTSILLETSRFWSERVDKGEDGEYHLLNVMGPDEYSPCLLYTSRCV